MSRIGAIFVAWAIALACALATRVVAANDLADEADLRFQLGAEHYTRGDYTKALEHFLASNRLVPNENVVFNIARTYEKLGKYPEAFRYYTQALDAERDPAARGRIEQSIEALRPKVVVLDIRTEPPGATLYVDRRNLGPRGTSPRLLGLPAGSYTVIADLEGYLPHEERVENAEVGATIPIQLRLEPILGTVVVRGEGAAVRVDDPVAPVACRTPCTLSLKPGRHVLHFERPRFRAASLPIDVIAHQEVAVHPALQPLTGTLVVATDEPGALVQVDGRAVGFTPMIATLPVGEHEVRVSLEGFRSLSRAVTIDADEERRISVELHRTEDVLAASRTKEHVEEAPSSVSIVGSREIRALAYPTIAEAVRSVRGIYVTDDRSYVDLGMRGVGRLGGYGTRLLVLVDGHPMNDNWLGSSYVGYDGRTDLDDVERIEVVRGPGSVLYGTNAFTGVINLVTRRERPGAEVAVGTQGNGVARARARGDLAFGDDAGGWVSVGAARGEGRDFFFPEYVAETTPGAMGVARGVDGFEAGTVQGRAWWRWLSARFQAHSHEKDLPTAEFETAFADPRTRQRDQRGYVELVASPPVNDRLSTMTRLHLNHYRFDGFYARVPAEGGLEVDTFRGSWVGLEERIRYAATRDVTLTGGAEGQLHFQVDQRARDDDGFFLDEAGDSGRPYQVGAVYALADAKLSESVSVSAGARLDAYSTFGQSINPRAAVVLTPYSEGTLKILAGRAFRAPSIYELYYNDDGITQIANPDLGPESIYSFEVEHTHRFSPTVSSTASVFANTIRDLVVQRGQGIPADPIVFDNSDTPFMSIGGEIGLRRDWRQGWMVGGWYSYTRAFFLADETLSSLLTLDRDPSVRQVANAPIHGASIQGAVPLATPDLLFASRLTLEAPRYDRFESVTDLPQGRTDGGVLWDLVLTGNEPRFGLSYSLGVYNAFDWRYAHPVSAEFRQRTIPQAGRTFLANATLRF